MKRASDGVSENLDDITIKEELNIEFDEYQNLLTDGLQIDPKQEVREDLKGDISNCEELKRPINCKNIERENETQCAYPETSKKQMFLRQFSDDETDDIKNELETEFQNNNTETRQVTPSDGFSPFNVDYSLVQIGDQQIPCISWSSQSYCLLRALKSIFVSELTEDIVDCAYIHPFSVSDLQNKFLVHIDSKFSDATFTTEDEFISIEESHLYYNFLKTCSSKLSDNTKNSNKCGLIKMMDETVIPYVVRCNSKLLPLCYFKNRSDLQLDLNKLKIETVSGWELSYLKFCCIVRGTASGELFESDACDVASLADIVECFPLTIKFEDYWPRSDSEFELLTPSQDTSLNNPQTHYLMEGISTSMGIPKNMKGINNAQSKSTKMASFDDEYVPHFDVDSDVDHSNEHSKIDNNEVEANVNEVYQAKVDPPAMFSNGPMKIRKRTFISLEQKAKILERLKCGEKNSKIAKELNINRSTISKMQQNEDKIRKKISIASSASINQIAPVRNNLLAKTENSLIIWIEDCRQKNIPLTGYRIKMKAVKIFDQLKEKEPDSKKTFFGSTGWYEGFKKRYSLNNCKLQDECSSADLAILQPKNSTESGQVIPTVNYNIVSIGDRQIPCISCSSQSYCLLRALKSIFVSELSEDMVNCAYIHPFTVSDLQNKFLVHIDLKFSDVTFKTEDEFISIEESHLYYNFLKTCSSKLSDNTNNSNKCGLIKMMDETVIPYVVRCNSKLLPLCYFKNRSDLQLDLNKLKIETVSGWELSYLKFCCIVRGTASGELFESDACDVANLTNIAECFPLAIKFEEYWPRSDSEFELLTPSHDISLNNPQTHYLTEGTSTSLGIPKNMNGKINVQSKSMKMASSDDEYVPHSDVDSDVDSDHSNEHSEIDNNEIEADVNEVYQAKVDPPAMLSNGPNKKLKRQYFSLEQKLQILDRIKCGEKIHKIADELNINRSTVSKMQKYEDKIRKRISIASSASINQITRVRNNLLARTENSLIIWIEDCRQKNIPLDRIQIKRKAIKIYHHLKEKECDSKDTFIASSGWYVGFKRRFYLNNLKLQDECSSAVKKQPKNSTESGQVIPTVNYNIVSIGDQQIPCISCSSQRYCLLRALKSIFVSKLSEDMVNCAYIHPFSVTDLQNKFLVHIDLKFSDLTTEDEFISIEESYLYYNFLKTCSSKLSNNTKNSRCGLIKIMDETVIPYVVRDNSKLLPLCYFKNRSDLQLDLNELKIETVRGWELSYLKFCCIVRGTASGELFERDACDIASLADIVECLPLAIKFEEYWPRSDSELELLTPSQDKSLNNPQSHYLTEGTSTLGIPKNMNGKINVQSKSMKMASSDDEYVPHSDVDSDIDSGVDHSNEHSKIDNNDIETDVNEVYQAKVDPPAMLSNGPKKKQKRKFISLEQKAQILERLKCGEKTSKISKELNICKSTIFGIQKSEDKILKRISIGSSVSINQIARVKNNLLARTENCLIIWIEDCCQKNVPLDSYQIKKKAIKIFEYLKENQPDSKETFFASNGWYEGFKRRFSFNNLKLHDEQSSADVDAANIFLNQFKTIIQTGGYTADQVFNADEMVLNWKTMPERTFLYKTGKYASGFKASKDRITLLLCSNASGDFFNKPLLVNRSLKPRAMKGMNMENLPVYWRANRKAWVTQDIFKDWFYNCFVPDVQMYTRRKNLTFKILLIIDNAPSHPKDLYHPNVNVIFVPPNTTSLIQPLDQGIIKVFKSYYIRHIFKLIVDQLNANSDTTLLKAWNDFSILNSVEIIDSCIKEMKSSTLNECWRCIWPEVVLNETKPISLLNENARIINLARSLGGERLEDMNENDINELINNNTELNEEDLVTLIDENVSNISEEINFKKPNEILTSERLNTGLQLFKELETYFIQCDSSKERLAELKKQLEICQAPYFKIQEEIQAKVICDKKNTSSPNKTKKLSD